jgi:hypothetical protein
LNELNTTANWMERCEFKENALYILQASNEKPLDASFKHRSCLYILQVTIADTHSIESGLGSRSNEWKLFVNGTSILKVPVFWKGSHLHYSAIISPEQWNLALGSLSRLGISGLYYHASLWGTTVGICVKTYSAIQLRIAIADGDVGIFLKRRICCDHLGYIAVRDGSLFK